MSKDKVCPKCNLTNGNDWSQCRGICPMPMSPHYNPSLTKPFTAEELEMVGQQLYGLEESSDLVMARLFAAVKRDTLLNQPIGSFVDKATCNHANNKAIIGDICRMCGTSFEKTLQTEVVQATLPGKKRSKIKSRSSKVKFPNHKG